MGGGGVYCSYYCFRPLSLTNEGPLAELEALSVLLLRCATTYLAAPHLYCIVLAGLGVAGGRARYLLWVTVTGLEADGRGSHLRKLVFT